MSIEQHHRHPVALEPAPDETGAAFAHLLHGLTRAVLGLPDEPTAPAPAEAGVPAVPLAPAVPVEIEPDPFAERRPTHLLGELGFLDD